MNSKASNLRLLPLQGDFRPVRPAKTPQNTGDEIARLLIKEGHLTPEQLAYAKRVRSKLATPKTLTSVLKELGFITNRQLQQTLRVNQVSMRIGALLVELGYMQEANLQTALNLQEQKKTPKKLGEILVESHYVEEQKLAEALAYQLGVPYVEPRFARIDKKLLSLVPPRWCTTYNFVPVGKKNGRVVVAFADPLDQQGRQAAQKIFGQEITPAIAPKRAIRETIAQFERHTVQGATTLSDETTVVGIVNTLLEEALQDNVSDIHIEPMRDRLRVRFRRDGVLFHHKDLPLELATAISSRIKILARADIAEKRRHQDGRFLFTDHHSGETIDLRVSFYVTIHGEKIVLRILNRQGKLLNIEDIGMAWPMLERFRDDALEIPTGVIIVTGPTGSGKTTTLYSCVNYLNTIHTSIITAEDPVEYVIDGIAQCSINPKINVTFEETLRHIVRQDPDVIVLGEIRDRFSAETAIQAALTGHKVLTTFHTEDSIGGLIRLLNMNIEAFLISSTVVCVVAQRLLRKVCPHCAEVSFPTPVELRRLGYDGNKLTNVTFMVGRGCDRCRFTGYAGRTGVFELLILNERVKDAILARKTSYEIRRISLETSGLVTLLEDGILKASKGITTVHEVLRHLPRLHKPRPLQELRRLLGE
jgi:type IV pilus assembly protein PilB